MYDFFYGFYKKRLGSNLFYRDNSTFVSPPPPPVFEVYEDNDGNPYLDNNDNTYLDNG